MPGTCNKRIAIRAPISGQVRDLQHLCTIDLDPADRVLDLRFLDIQTVPGLEPLSIDIEKGNQRDRHAASLGRNKDKVVERLLGGSVEDHQIRKCLGARNRAHLGRVSAQSHWSPPSKKLLCEGAKLRDDTAHCFGERSPPASLR